MYLLVSYHVEAYTPSDHDRQEEGGDVVAGKVPESIFSNAFPFPIGR